MKQNKIFVGSLSSSTTEVDLREAFTPFGSIDDIKIIIDIYTGESKGFAFITFLSNSSAVNALDMDGKEIKERRIRVSLAKKKENFRDKKRRW